MYQVKDLYLDCELLPLFDYTRNDYAQKKLKQIIETPLVNLEEIIKRQEILKGLIKQGKILDQYAYSRHEFNEVYQFITDTQRHQSILKSRLKLYWNKGHKLQTKARISQVVLFLHKLAFQYFSRIDIQLFPLPFQKQIQWLQEFLASFNLNFYQNLISEGKLKIKHLIEIERQINQQHIDKNISVFYEKLLHFEALLSISQAITKQGFCFPSFDDNHFEAEDIYHPILKNAVKNSVRSPHSVVLLTGPNMSGKSTFLKAIGVAIHLSHTGLAVPAKKMTLPYFEHVLISINHQDDLCSGYSHFMQEIMNLKEIVTLARGQKKCFAIFDELFKGTNVDDAIAISLKTLEGLSQMGPSLFFISTHLHALKDAKPVIHQNLKTLYLDCTISDQSPIFNYQVKEGWSDLKIGQIIFEQQGLNELFSSSAGNRSLEK